MDWLIWLFAAGLILALLAWCFWEFVLRSGRVGRTDLSDVIHETVLIYLPGTTISMRGRRSNARVVLTKCEVEGASSPVLEMVISGDAANREKLQAFAATLGVLGIEHEVTDRNGREFRAMVSTAGVQRDIWGRVVDHALLTAGMVSGERYRYEFRGDSDLDALKAFAERKRAGLE